MIWMEEIYVGEKAQKHAEQIIQGINTGQPPYGAYVLVYPSNSKNQLDILSANDPLFSYYAGQDDFQIVGIAKGREDAFGLVEKITQEAMETTGSPWIRQFLEKRQKKQGGEED